MQALLLLDLALLVAAASRLHGFLFFFHDLFGLLDDSVQLLISQLLALAPEHLLQVVLGDVAFAVRVEVVERELEVGPGQSDLLVHCGRQELRVVNRAIVVKVQLLKERVEILGLNLGHVAVQFESLLNLIHGQNSRV